jgi:hypothetical protein
MPWAMAIARHVWLMDRRTLSRRPWAPDDEMTMELPVKARARVARGARPRCAARSAKLRPARRDAVIQHHLLGFSFKEIAERAAIAENRREAAIRAGPWRQLRRAAEGAGRENGRRLLRNCVRASRADYRRSRAIPSPLGRALCGSLPSASHRSRWIAAPASGRVRSVCGPDAAESRLDWRCVGLSIAARR